MAKSTKNQRAQLGFELAPGVAVPATFRPNSFTTKINPKASTESVTPSGEDFVSDVYRNDEWSEGTLEGKTSYNELPFLLQAVLGRPEATNELANNRFERLYKFNSDRPTFSIEYGDNQDASVYAGVFATGLDLEFGLNSGTASVSVGLKGGAVQDGYTMTPRSSLNVLSSASALASHVDVYGSVDAADMATTKPENYLTGWMSIKTSLSGTSDRVKFFDRESRVDLQVGATVEIKVNLKTSEGRQYVQYLRDGRTFYMLVRLESDGNIFDQRFAVKVSDLGDRGDDSGAYVATYTATIVGDQTYMPSWRVVNKIPFEAHETATEVPPVVPED